MTQKWGEFVATVSQHPKTGLLMGVWVFAVMLATFRGLVYAVFKAVAMCQEALEDSDAPGR